MMLSDRELRELAEKKDLVKPFISQNCEGATINLTLGNVIKKYISKEPITLGKEVNEKQYKKIDISKKSFALEPHDSVMVHCNEVFKIPDDTASIIFERYSIKLLGLSISPASYMNPGYEGNMSFIAVNNSSTIINLVPGIKFCQMGLLKLTSESEKPYRIQDGKYMGSKDVSISKLHLDKEIQDFLKSKGVLKVSEETANELGSHLMKHIEQSSKNLASILREEFGDPVNE